jgi:hypothetical protein
VRPYFEKNHHAHKKSSGGVAQGIGPEFKPQFCTKKKKKEKKRKQKSLYGIWNLNSLKNLEVSSI